MMVRSVIIGITMGTVVLPIPNCVVVFLTTAVDFLLEVFMQPHIEAIATVTSAVTSGFRLGMVSVTFAYVMGAISDETMEALFTLFTLGGFLPGLYDTVVNGFSNLVALVQSGLDYVLALVYGNDVTTVGLVGSACVKVGMIMRESMPHRFSRMMPKGCACLRFCLASEDKDEDHDWFDQHTGQLAAPALGAAGAGAVAGMAAAAARERNGGGGVYGASVQERNSKVIVHAQLVMTSSTRAQAAKSHHAHTEQVPVHQTARGTKGSMGRICPDSDSGTSPQAQPGSPNPTPPVPGAQMLYTDSSRRGVHLTTVAPRHVSSAPSSSIPRDPKPAPPQPQPPTIHSSLIPSCHSFHVPSPRLSHPSPLEHFPLHYHHHPHAHAPNALASHYPPQLRHAPAPPPPPVPPSLQQHHHHHAHSPPMTTTSASQASPTVTPPRGGGSRHTASPPAAPPPSASPSARVAPGHQAKMLHASVLQ
jgi:hypothetical protein